MAARSISLPRNVLSLCSGVGGLDLGLRAAVPQARTVCFLEGEAFAVACLVKAMQSGALDDAPVWSDLTTFDGCPWRGVVDTVIAGFPCQPASVAGKGLGTADERWLWNDIARILGEVQPAWVFLENVPGLLSAPGEVGGEGGGDVVRGGAYGSVLGTLADLGFAAEWDLFRASETGATHRRERWFLLAHAARNGGGGCKRPSRSGRRVRGAGDDVGDVGDTNGQREQQSDDAGSAVAREDSRVCSGGAVRVMGVAHNAGPQGRSESIGSGRDELHAWPPGPEDDAGWSMVLARCPWLAPALPVEPALCGGTDGIPVQLDPVDRIDRLRALGNAVCPQQAAMAFNELLARILEE